ncbi:hypothetical protein AAC387_Pa02g1164 [Persea americana]
MSGKVNYEFKGSCLSSMNSTETFVEADDDFEDEFEEDTELHVGDGSGGGGILLAGTWRDRKALDLAAEVWISFGGDLKIYAFKTSASSTIKYALKIWQISMSLTA